MSDAGAEHDHGVPPSAIEMRVRALEDLLVDKGYVDRAALDACVETYEFKVGPRNGAKVVARAWVGVVTHVHGCHAYPDSRAHGGGDQPQWLSTVRFRGPELWGEGTDPTVSVSIDAFGPYLEPLDAG